MERTRVLEWAEKNFISSENYLKIAKEDHTMKTAVQFKNALSAYVYLTTWYLSSYNQLKDTKEANLTKNKRKGVKKDKTTDEQKTA